MTSSGKRFNSKQLDPGDMKSWVNVHGLGELQMDSSRVHHPLHLKRTYEPWSQNPRLHMQQEVPGGTTSHAVLDDKRVRGSCVTSPDSEPGKKSKGEPRKCFGLKESASPQRPWTLAGSGDSCPCLMIKARNDMDGAWNSHFLALTNKLFSETASVPHRWALRER